MSSRPITGAFSTWSKPSGRLIQVSTRPNKDWLRRRALGSAMVRGRSLVWAVGMAGFASGPGFTRFCRTRPCSSTRDGGLFCGGRDHGPGVRAVAAGVGHRLRDGAKGLVASKRPGRGETPDASKRDREAEGNRVPAVLRKPHRGSARRDRRPAETRATRLTRLTATRSSIN
jgi:hypothetical protein